MSAGLYTRWLTWQVLVPPADDGTGGQEETGWTDLVQVWGRVVPLSGRQVLQAGLLQTEITHRIEGWYRQAIVDERRALRVRDQSGLTYHVRAVRDVEGRRLRLECDAVQVTT